MSTISALPSLSTLGQEPKKHDLFAKLKWDLLVGDRMPTFAPAAELAGNPRGLAGVRLVFMADARQTLKSAASVVRRAKKGDNVALFAFSYDHPTVTDAIVEAVYRGAEVSIYMDHGYVCGDSKSLHCKQTLIDALKKTAGARWPGKLRVYSQRGSCVKAAYERHGRCSKALCDVLDAGGPKLGNCHTKALYTYPYLIVGSTNWSVCSESNLELGLLLEIQDRESREYVEKYLQSLTNGAVEQNAVSIAESLRSPSGGVVRGRG